MTILLIGSDCIQNKTHKNECSHVVHADGVLHIWDIKDIRINVFKYDSVQFISNTDLNFTSKEDVFDKLKQYPHLQHFIGNRIKTSVSDHQL